MRGSFWLCAPLLAAPVSFEKQIQPLLAERCGACHQESNRSGNLSFASYSGVAAAVRPGDPGKSALYAAVSGTKPRMPKFGKPLDAAQVALIRDWIAAGAKDDSTGAAPAAWWSLRPLSPASGKSIDAFLQEKLAAAGLKPSAEADRRTLIRRLTFDLHGLPPTPAEVDAFVGDAAPDAYARLVDRLLASPRYGERWARHWLDIVHYGDSHGYDKDKPRHNAWPYRDWVIAALNRDKPYARFVEEQIAGDVLYPDSPEAFTATGFLAAGPWDFVGHQELREGTVEKDNTRLLDRDDVVAATMSTFVSTTVHCARCHDHKFDPIPQRDYYAVQAVFAGIDRADRPFDDDPALHAQRQEMLRRKQAIQLRLQPLLDKVEFAQSPEIEELTNRIQDANLLAVHIGTPKTAAEAEEKRRLQERMAADRKRRQELVDALVGRETYAAIERVQAELKLVDAELARLPQPRLVYAGAAYFNRVGNFRPALQPRPVSVLARGSVQSPVEPAAPGALQCVSALQPRFDAAEEGARRAALAKWIADPRNPLTWRSIVNRVWQYHFGAGIVETPSDFGRMGAQPSHPELLDEMAAWFRDDARGSLKQLHRRIVLSAAYRQSSAHREDGARADAGNRLLWRMNRARLEAEPVRDAALAVAGKLDLTMGGPAPQWFRFKDDHSPVYDYARFDPDAPGAYRRSIYRFIVRSVPDPFLERLDCPDPSLLAPTRSTTLTAIQALALWNNPFMTRMAEHYAARAGGVREAVRLAWQREPSAAEAREFEDYAARHGLANFCRLLLNSNEFLFVD